MQQCLEIDLSINKQNEIDVQLNSRVGECKAIAALPFDSNELAVVLRALEINRALSETFDQDEWKLLKDWGIVEGEFVATKSDEMELSEKEFDIDPLLELVQKKLYYTLFPDRCFERVLSRALGQIPSGEALHIRLALPSGESNQTQNIQLFQYPWEVLSCKSVNWFGNQSVAFSRHIKFSQPMSNPELLERKLNLLVVRAFPDDLGGMLGSDAESIEQGLQDHSLDYWIEVRKPEQPEKDHRGTMEQLSDQLSSNGDLRDVPHVLHFGCHGRFGRRCLNGSHVETDWTRENCQECKTPLSRDFYGYLAFEKPNMIDPTKKDVHWVSGDEVARLLAGHQLKFVFLNACSSALGRRGEDIFNGVAQRLIQYGIPAVISTPFRIDEEGAKKFAQYFYQELGRGKTLVEATDSARQRLSHLQGFEREWYRYVLYLRQQDGGEGMLLHSQPKKDLSGWDLTGKNLSRRNFSSWNFSNTTLTGADLRETNFSETNLEGSTLSNLDLSQTDLTKAILNKADLHKAKFRSVIWIDTDEYKICTAKLEKTEFVEANLTNVDLTETKLENINLFKANLSEAKLNRASLKNVNLQQAQLSGADLRETNWEEVELDGANLIGAKLSQVSLQRVKLDGETTIEEKWRHYLYIRNKQGNRQGVDLSDVNLSKADLSWLNLSRVSLYRANLNEADLRGIVLCGADLSKTKLFGADLREANLCRANLRQAELYPHDKEDDSIVNPPNSFKAILFRANLCGADLHGANLNEADLSGANLTGAILSEAHLYKATLKDAILTRANLQGAHLNEAAMQGANLSMADLRGAELIGADLIGANLSKVNLYQAKLSYINLSGANLDQADLKETDLTGADLREANLRGVDLYGAKMKRANLQGATIPKNLLKKAQDLDGAIMPDGTVYKGK